MSDVQTTPKPSPFLWILTGFLVGITCGFFLGVFTSELGSELLESALTSEEAADVQNPTTLEREGFSVQYPGNWQIEEDDEENDVVHMFNIESPAENYVGFSVYTSAMGLEELVADMVGEFKKTAIKNATETKFDTWGSLKGRGVLLKGRFLAITPGAIRVFASKTATRTLVVYEFCQDEESKLVEPGFELIRKSFVLE